jgi:hypothetical protein
MDGTQCLQKSQSVFKARLGEHEKAEMSFFRGELASAGNLFLAQRAIFLGKTTKTKGNTKSVYWVMGCRGVLHTP